MDCCQCNVTAARRFSHKGLIPDLGVAVCCGDIHDSRMAHAHCLQLNGVGGFHSSRLCPGLCCYNGIPCKLLSRISLLIHHYIGSGSRCIGLSNLENLIFRHHSGLCAQVDKTLSFQYAFAFLLVFLLMEQPDFSGNGTVENLTPVVFKERVRAATPTGVTTLIFLHTKWSLSCRQAYSTFTDLSERFSTERVVFTRMDLSGVDTHSCQWWGNLIYYCTYS